MAESAITFLFNQLSIWLQEEDKLLGALGQEVELLRDEMGQMKAFLRVADAKEESDPRVKEWSRQVREIAYDTEDVLEIYMLRFAHHNAHGFSGSLKKICGSMKNLKAGHQIASKIKAIRSRLENASKTFRDMYPPTVFPESTSTLATRSNTWYDGRGDALLLEEVDVVGIEKPKKQFLEWLSSIDYSLKVISVVGMAGLGKTTLVKKVYDDPSVKLNFHHRAWVTVSESFKVENLLQDIIKRLLQEVKQSPPQGFEAMKANGMREFIYNFLQNKNYIIVMDDIWTTNAWEAVRYAFPRSTTNGRGCIIITTRFNNIGNVACSETNGPVHVLEPLPEEESRQLFYRKAFPRNLSPPPDLKEISTSILKRCKGWPLAIVVIGGLLATKNEKIEEWEMFNRSLGFELQGDNLKRMWKLLSLSFYDLPCYLKACFLYSSIFPEDQVIQKAMIIRLWTAEGFVEAKQGKTMEEMAEGYLHELLNRSLIQAVGTYVDGRPRKFRMHDLVREYIISKAGEQNIATVNSRGEVQLPDRTRRLAVHSSTNCAVQPICNYEYLRSLLFLGPTDLGCKPFLYKVLRGGCRMLKVLDSGGAPWDTIPIEVYKLYYLKHMSLRGTQVEVIPKSIGNLRKLETLDLKDTGVTELPIEILRLQKLRNLLVYRYGGEGVQGFSAPYEMGRLSCLVKLCYIDAGGVVRDDGQMKIVGEIGKLSQLERLGIINLRREDGMELCSSLKKLANLRSLNIFSFDEEGEQLMDLDYSLSPTISPANSTLPFLRTLFLQGRLEKVPQWIPSLNALAKLVLRLSRLQDDPLECLQDLPNLVELRLIGAYEGEGLSFEARGFQKLKELWLKRLGGLRWVRIEKGSMPLLDDFVLEDCKSMTEAPVGINHLTILRRLLFVDMTTEFQDKLSDEKRREGDQWKFAHVHEAAVANRVNGEWVQRRL